MLNQNKYVYQLLLFLLYIVVQNYSMMLRLWLAVSKRVSYIVFLELQGSDISCFDGLVNFVESAVKSESEKGVVNSRLCQFHVCSGRIIGANFLSCDCWCGCKVANPQYSCSCYDLCNSSCKTRQRYTRK